MDDIRTYTHPEGAAPARADKILSEFFAAETSRSRLEESFRDGKVKINGSPIQKKQKLVEGDIVEIELPKALETEVKPMDIPLDIVYEDEHIIAVNKAAGMTVHPGSGTGDDTLCHAMLFHCKGKLSMAGGAMRPGIVHRLDKETSGIMLMAKTDQAYFKLVKQFSERELEKEYIALISGVPTVRSGVVTKNIARHPSFRTKMCAAEDDSIGREAYTEWFLEKTFGNAAALVSCRIETGRTHQIRVHMTDIGFPIMGDYTYKFQKNKFKDIPAPERVMLHAHKLKLAHPITGEELDLKAEAPKDFKDLQKLLEKTYS